MKTILWEKITPDGEAYHLARAHIRPRSRNRVLHCQNFPEIFWIERGKGIHYINGAQLEINPGDLIWIRAGDCHGFRCKDSDGFILTNLAFSQKTADHLRQRYFQDETRFLWHTGDLPGQNRMDAARMKHLAEWTRYLNRAPRTQLEIDRVLIDILHRLQAGLPKMQSGELPHWLKDALEKFNTPEQFAGGVQALAGQAGRTPEHVNATLKQVLNITATEAVNRARMDYAADELRISTKKILEICFDCGFENLGYFYKVFQKYFNTTPRSYRLRHLTTVDS